MTTTDLSELVQHIAQALQETEETPIKQIKRIIKRCGPEQAQAWLEQAQAREAAGGEMLSDNSRRRTLGGIFFKIVRQSITRKDRVYIFPHYHQQATTAPGVTDVTPQVHTASWDEREQLVKTATYGKATTVKITIIGRPGKVIERPAFTLLLMKRSGPLPPLPKGVPAPPQNETDYIVYVGAKQWAKVKESIKKAEDVLICEGTPVLDPKFNAITVFATNVTTKLLQQAQRQEHQSTE